MRLFELAGQQADWLSARQRLIASNISHSNSPGYRAVDIAPFAGGAASFADALAQTSAGHMAASDSGTAYAIRPERAWTTVLSGNSVNLDQQLLKANDVRAAYNLNAAIVRSFNRMIMASAKG